MLNAGHAPPYGPHKCRECRVGREGTHPPDLVPKVHRLSDLAPADAKVAGVVSVPLGNSDLSCLLLFDRDHVHQRGDHELSGPLARLVVILPSRTQAP